MIAEASPFLHDEPEFTRLDWMIHGLMCCILAFLPFAFGGTQAWSQEIFFCLTTAAVSCVIFRKSAGIRWSWAYLPIACFLLLILAQLTEWPTAFVAGVSPHTAGLRTTFLGDRSNTASRQAHQTLTFYPQATRELFRLVLAVSGIFFVVNQFYRNIKQIDRLLFIIAVIGIGVSLLAVYQNATGATTVYGVVPAPHRNAGPFMNYSHFSQFINLSIGASIALALLLGMSAVQKLQPRFHSVEDVKDFLGHRSMRWVKILAVAVVIESCTVFLSMSRMGAVSLMASGALTGGLITWRSRSTERGSIALIFSIVILTALLCVGFDSMYARLATMRHVQQADGGRLQMLRDMGAAIKTFPLVGTGLGTHEYVFPMFDHSAIHEVATHAEDEFAQLLEETGILGLLLIVSFVAFIARKFWVCIRRPRQPVQFVGFGLGFGLLAILIHSFSDFGQHVPADAVLTACSAALLVNIAALSPRSKKSDGAVIQSSQFMFASSRQTILKFGFGLAVAAIGYWCINGANAARNADTAWDTALAAAVDLRDHQWNGDDSDYGALLVPAAQAVELQPDNVKYRYWLETYRWRSLVRPSSQNASVFQLKRSSLPVVDKIVLDLGKAEYCCPTYGPAYSLAGELEHFVLFRPEGVADVDRGFRLSPKDPIVAFISGEFAVGDQRWSDALAAFRVAAADGAFKSDAITILVSRANRPDLAYQLAVGDSGSLNQLINLLVARPKDKSIADACRNDLITLLQQQADQPTTSAESLASLADQFASRQSWDKAILYYRKALDLNYGCVEWHFRLATALAQSGDTAGGMGEARVCLRLRPQMQEAETLLGNLSVRSPGHSGV